MHCLLLPLSFRESINNKLKIQFISSYSVYLSFVNMNDEVKKSTKTNIKLFLTELVDAELELVFVSLCPWLVLVVGTSFSSS